MRHPPWTFAPRTHSTWDPPPWPLPPALLTTTTSTSTSSRMRLALLRAAWVAQKAWQEQMKSLENGRLGVPWVESNAECWGWGLGGMDVKQCGGSSVFFSLKGGRIFFWQQNLFGVRGWFELSVWSSWYFDVVFVFFPHYPPTKRDQGTNVERINDATGRF